MKYLFAPIASLLLLTLLTGSCNSTRNGADTNSNSNDIVEREAAASAFEIGFKRKGTETLLSCTSGCSWTNLSFDQRNYGVQYVNNDGMVELEEVNNTSGSMFLLKLTDDGANMKVEGLSGTTFKSLSFSCGEECDAMLNQDGMISD